MDDNNLVPVFAPDGKVKGIKPSDLDKALASGGQRGIVFTAPDGKTKLVKQSDALAALNAGGFVADPGSLTINPGKEGTYKMAGPGGMMAPVPYSLIGSAAKLGYQMNPEDRKKYIADAAADPALKNIALPTGVKATGRNTAGQIMIAPEEEAKPGFFRSAAQTFGGVAKGIGHLVDPVATAEEQQRAAQSGTAGKIYDAVMYPWERLVAPNIAEGERANEEAQGGSKYEAAMHGAAAAIPFVGPMAEQTREQFAQQEADKNWAGLAGTASANVLLVEAPHLAKPISTVLSNSILSLPEGFRAGVRRTLGITDKTEDFINAFKKNSEDVRAANKKADEETLGQHGEVDDARIKALKKHQDDLEEHRQKVEKIAEEHSQNTSKRELENENLRQKHRDLTKKAQEENIQALKDHFAKLEEIAHERQAAQGIENQRATMEQQVSDDSKELFDRGDKAEKQAQADDKTAWDDVRAKTQGQTTDLGPIQKVVEVASEKADPATSALFKSITNEKAAAARPVTLNGVVIDATHQHYADLYEATWGEPPPIVTPTGTIPFERLQRWYSFLSNKMYGGGRIEGGLFNAYKMVRTALDQGMQDIATKAKATAELANARKVHTERMEAFSDKPTEESTVKTAYEKSVTPEEAREALQEEWEKKIGRYDPEIPKLGERLRKARGDLKKLPSPEQTRKMMASQPPEPPVPGAMPASPEFKPPLERPEYPKPPESPGIPEPAPAGENIPETLKYPLAEEEPTSKSLTYKEPGGARPLPEPKEIPEQIRHALRRGLRRYGALGGWVLRSIVGGVVEHLAHGELSTFGSTMLMGQAAVTILTDALSRPSTIEWLAKPTAEDLKMLETLPPADAARLREALTVMAAEDLRKMGGSAPPPFDPVVSRFLLGVSAGQGQRQQLEDLKKQAAKRKPSAAPGPQAKAKNYTHIFDPATGTIRAA